MTAPSIADERDLIFSLHRNLVGVWTPAGWLEAVSDYARSRGASGASILWIDNAEDGSAGYMQVAARWLGDAPARPMDEPYKPLPGWWRSTGGFFADPITPTLINDVTDTPYLDEETRDDYLGQGIRAVAFLPQYLDGEWVSALVFRWAEPQQFDGNDFAVYSMIMQHAAPFINAIRLLEVNRSRAERAERLRLATEDAVEEAAFLYQLAGTINAATTYQEIVESVKSVLQDCEGVLIDIWENGNFEGASYVDVVAISSEYEPRVPRRRMYLDEFPVAHIMQDERVWMIEDIEHDPRLDEVSRASWLEIGVRGVMAIQFWRGERWIGGMYFDYVQPRQFTERERRLAAGIGDLAAAAVERIRAGQDIEAAHKQAEAEREESALLYRLSQAVNAAMTFEEVIEAVAIQSSDYDGIFLNLWEDYDFDTATMVDVWGIAQVNGVRAPVRKLQLPVDAFPISQTMRHETFWFVEDVQTDPRVDERSLQTYRAYNMLAVIGAHLHLGDRLIGGIGFRYAQPRRFTERDKRLAKGISDLVLAAIERIRAMSAMEAAHRQAEEDREEAGLLYQLAEVVNAATTYQEVAQAVANLYPESDGVFIDMWEGWDYDSARYFTNIANANAQGIMQSVGDPCFLKASFPLAGVLRHERVWMIEDADSDPRVDPITRRLFSEWYTRAYVGVPFVRDGRYSGGVYLSYTQPRTFDARERRLALGIGDLVAAAVDRIRSQLEMDAARQRSEEDREESALLYRLAEAVNAATNYDEIAQAVLRLHPSAEGVFVQLWEGMDYATADYYQVVGAAVRGAPLRVDGDIRMIIAKTGLRSYYDQVHTERPWIVEDTQTDPRLDDAIRETYRRLPARATMVVVFKQGERWMGSISFRYSQPHHFSERDKRVGIGIGDLVQAAVQRIRSQQETDAARRRAEIMARVSAALSQAQDEMGIVEALAPLAEATGAVMTSLSYVDDGQNDDLRVVAARAWQVGLPSSAIPPTGFVFDADSFPLVRMFGAEPERILFMDSTLAQPGIEMGDQLAFVMEAGWMASVILPCHTGEKFVGALVFIWTERQTFDEATRDLFISLRPIVSSVIKTRRAYLAAEAARRETEQRAREMQTVAQVSAAAVTMLDEPQLLEAVTWLMQANFQPHYVSLFMLEYDHLVLRSGTRDANFVRVPINGETSVARAARSRTSVIGRERWQGETDDELPAGGYSVELAAPIAVGDMLLGVLCLRALPGFTLGESDLRVVSTLADLIAVAVQNVRSYRGAQELAALEERTRLARELHDSVSQALYGIGLGARTAKTLLDRDPSQVRGPIDYVLSLAEAGLAEMRALIFELRPESLENEGLMTALVKQASSLQARHNLEVKLDLGDEPTMPLDQKESLYRVAREALHNVVKHAAATQVTLRLCADGDALALDVIDNGRGFDTGGQFPGHLGLQSMRERVAALGGAFEMTSAPGAGSHIRVRLPL
jgi:signal transduction histidine kinase